jgi:DNA-binding MarR family transcriptional regulator
MTKIYCPDLYPQKSKKYRNKELDKLFTIYCNENKGIDEDIIAMSLADKIGWSESKVKMYLRKLGLRKFTCHLNKVNR